MDQYRTDDDTKQPADPLLDLEEGCAPQQSASEYSLECIWSEIV